MNANPFRNAIATFDLLPDELKPAFLSAFNDDWSDLTSNGNPLEHLVVGHPENASDADAAISYILEWAGYMCDTDSPTPKLLNEPELSDSYKTDPETTREILRRLADAYDLIPFESEPIESTFANEHISTGHFIDVDSFDESLLTDTFTVTVTDDDNPTVYTFRVVDNTVTLAS